MTASADPPSKKQKILGSAEDEPVLVIGANGYIGSGVVRALKEAGWQHIAGLVRNEPGKIAAAKQAGADEVITITSFDTDRDALSAAVHAFKMCINTATYTGEGIDAVVNQIILEALPTATHSCVFIYTSGNLVCGEQDLATEGEDAALTSPFAFSSWRVAVEGAVRNSNCESLRSVIVRPSFVYGGSCVADYLIRSWFESAEGTGSAKVIGDGSNWLPIVHIDDLAQLYVLLLRSPTAQGVYHALEPSDFATHTTHCIAKACSVVAGNGSVEMVPIADVKKNYPDGFAEAFALKQRLGSLKSQRLGWEPRQFDAALAYTEFKQSSRGKLNPPGGRWH